MSQGNAKRCAASAHKQFIFQRTKFVIAYPRKRNGRTQGHRSTVGKVKYPGSKAFEKYVIEVPAPKQLAIASEAVKMFGGSTIAGLFAMRLPQRAVAEQIIREFSVAFIVAALVTSVKGFINGWDSAGVLFGTTFSAVYFITAAYVRISRQQIQDTTLVELKQGLGGLTKTVRQIATDLADISQETQYSVRTQAKLENLRTLTGIANTQIETANATITSIGLGNRLLTDATPVSYENPPTGSNQR